jgi:hypothetical protein
MARLSVCPLYSEGAPALAEHTVLLLDLGRASAGAQYSVSSAPNSAIIFRQRSFYESSFSRDRD